MVQLELRCLQKRMTRGLDSNQRTNFRFAVNNIYYPGDIRVPIYALVFSCWPIKHVVFDRSLVEAVQGIALSEDLLCAIYPSFGIFRHCLVLDKSRHV